MSELKLPSLNKVMITGRLTRDPEVRYIQTGVAVAKLGLASNRYIRDRDSASGWKEETCFVDVTAWRELAERCADSLKKGSSVLVEGRLQSRSWEDKETGKKRTGLDIVADRVQFLDRRGDGQSAPAYAGGGKSQSAAPGGSSQGDGDDIPF
ncbi:MAG: single-stranded DNA-binding protein, partial [Gemmatimonadota bacterium]|nr:single-stranded DNA-binding protein [Gemmatimonadota bacterium]